ncbi:MAG: hypothetical protein JWN65_352, partial [Solirubrobacterales bacterium]|nr:hypothetical protein [Solirubrobacterales bacterium]
LGAGRRVTVRLRPGAAVRRTLAGVRRLRVTVHITARDAAGRTVVVTRRLLLP